MKQNQIQKLKSKKAPCTDSEWEAILEVILLQKESDPEKAAAVQGIEVEAAIEEDVAVELIFKKSTSGITVCPPPSTIPEYPPLTPPPSNASAPSASPTTKTKKSNSSTGAAPRSYTPTP